MFKCNTFGYFTAKFLKIRGMRVNGEQLVTVNIKT